jgi:hypothetical protein
VVTIIGEKERSRSFRATQTPGKGFLCACHVMRERKNRAAG